MELQQESSKFGTLSAKTLRNLSSSSSAFVSASQSPFFSPRSPKSQPSESTRFDTPNSSNCCAISTDPVLPPTTNHKPDSASSINCSTFVVNPAPTVCTSSDFQRQSGVKIFDQLSSPIDICNDSVSNCSQETSNGHSRNKEKQKRWGRNHRKFSYTPTPASLSASSRLWSCDIYIGIHGWKPPLLRFSNWLRAELELQGISCFVADRARCRNTRSHDAVEKAMDACNFGVVILTKKSFGNPYSIEELKYFLNKKNLVPIFFDLGPGDCLARDIIEKRGEWWEKHGGELWMLYGGLEKEWREAVNGLLRVEDWKLDAHNGNWRDCILQTVILLATKSGRRSVVERVNRCIERVQREEFPFPRNEKFIGRKKELSELEFILFGDVSGDWEREYFELKTKHKRKNSLIGLKEERRKGRETPDSGSKGKEPVIWKESEKEIEMQRLESSPQRQRRPLRAKHGRRKRFLKTVYGKGIAIVSGDSGIGKTELLLEFGYRFCQRYKMVLWVGGETRFIRQNYLNLSSFLEVDVSIESPCPEKGRIKSFEEQEDAAISRVRKELMRDIPFLVVIDNIENEKDWWDQRYVMDLLPRLGGEAHLIIATRLPSVMNLEPLKLSYLSGAEAMSLMKRRYKEYPIAEIDALRVIEEKLNRLTLGLGIVGAILSELPINPSRLLDTINRMPLKDMIWSGREASTLKRHTFLLQLLEVCFSIFDHADGPRSLATLMVQVSGWFSPAAIPISLLALAAHKLPEKKNGSQLWKRCLQAISCKFSKSCIKRSEAEASSTLIRFGIARSSNKPMLVNIHEIIKLYSRKRGINCAAQAVVQSISMQGSVSQHSEHLWEACFLLFGFGTDQVAVELKPPELMYFTKRVVLPLAIHTFITFSRCNAALELLRRCTEVLEAAEMSLVSRAEKWLDKSLCWRRPVQSNAQLNPYLWQELTLLRAIVLETRVKLMLRGGQYGLGDDLIRKAIFIRTSICGEHHPDTISSRDTLSKLTRLLSSIPGNS